MYNCIADIKRVDKCNYFNSLSRVKLFFTFIVVISAFLFFVNNICTNYRVIVFAESAALEEDVQQEILDGVDEVLNDVDFSELETLFDEYKTHFSFFEGLSLKDVVVKLISGELVLDFNSVFSLISYNVKNIVKEIVAPLALIFTIILLCVLFNNLRAQKISGVGDVVGLVCFSVVIILISAMLSSVISEVKISLVKLQDLISSIFPVLLTLLTIMGGVKSVAAYSPFIAFFGSVISTVFVYVLLPLFTFSLILSILGNLSSNAKLDKLNGFVFALFKWILATTFTVFIAFLSFQGLTAGGVDGISIKATKYAIKNYIPMLGGYISDGFELVKAGGMLVKNATGFVGIVIMIGSIIKPVLTVGVIELGLKLLAGLAEPVGGKQASSLLYSVAKSLKLLVVILLGVALMFFLTVFLMMSSASNFL